MATCKNCLHYDVCIMHYKQKCELTYETEREIRIALRKAKKAVDIECDHYKDKDRFRFVELKTAHWIKCNKADYNFCCSRCGYGFTDNKTSYCYDCGAKMEK